VNNFLNKRTFCWFCLCSELHVVMMKPMISVFWDHLLLHSQTIRAASNARCGRPQGGKQHADKSGLG